MLRQYKWWLISSALIGAVVGLSLYFVLLRTSPRYSAHAIFEVNPAPESATNIGRADNQSVQGIERELNTRAATMVQPGMLRSAIGDSRVRDQTRWIQQFRTPSGTIAIDAAAEQLRRQVSAVPFSETNLIRLSITGSSREDLTTLLQAIVDVYMESVQQEKRADESELGRLLRQQLEDVDEQITSINNLIEAYRADNGLNGNPNDDPARLELLNLTEQSRQTSEALGALMYRASQLDERLRQANPSYTDEEYAVAEQDPEVLRLTSQIVELQRQRRVANEDFGPRHRRVLELEREIRAAEEEREREIQEALARNLRLSAQQVQTEAASQQARLESIETQREQIAARVAELDRHQAWLDQHHQELERLEAERRELVAKKTEAQYYYETRRTDPVVVRQRPIAEAQPTFPDLKVFGPLGVLLATGLTAGLIFLREATDRRVKGPGDVALLPAGHVLGVIPHAGEDPRCGDRLEMVAREHPGSLIAESMRQVRNAVLREMEAAGHRTLLVVGAQPGSGSTSLVSNLAVSLARSERRVLVLDANLRRPGLARVFNIDPEPGLGDVLAGTVEATVAVRSTDVPGVFVLPAGATEHHGVERLTTEKFAVLLDELSQAYDVVLIDSPAAVAAADSQVLAQQADASILVVRAMQEERGLVTRLIGQLREARAVHLGVVLNGARSSAGGYFKRNFQQMSTYQPGVRP